MKKIRFILIILIAGFLFTGCSNEKDEKAIAKLEQEKQEQGVEIDSLKKGEVIFKTEAKDLLDSIAELNGVIGEAYSAKMRSILIGEKEIDVAEADLADMKKKLFDSQDDNARQKEIILAQQARIDEMEKKALKDKEDAAALKAVNEALLERNKGNIEAAKSAIARKKRFGKHLEVVNDSTLRYTKYEGWLYRIFH